jgi:autotransporter passenger strand-loop-strand repeat protein
VTEDLGWHRGRHDDQRPGEHTMTTTSVTSDQTVSGLTLNNGDLEYVLSGGTSSATTISGGTEYVYSGGYDFGTIINSSVGSAGRLIKTRSHRIGRVTPCCLGAIPQRRPMRGRIVVRGAA